MLCHLHTKFMSGKHLFDTIYLQVICEEVRHNRNIVIVTKSPKLIIYYGNFRKLLKIFV